MTQTRQSGALIIVAKAKGWDPTTIDGFDGQQADLGAWDVDYHRDPIKHKTTGVLPNYAPQTEEVSAEDPISERVTWNQGGQPTGNEVLHTNGAYHSPAKPY